MIERPRREYEAMRDVEDTLWWYRVLDKLVVSAIARRFPDRPPAELKLLDAGCGTGGLMRHLAARGYTQCEGFDLSDAAVELARASGMNVQKLDLREAPSGLRDRTFDVVVSNEVLYYLPKPEWQPVLASYRALLADGGLMIMNLAAGKKYRGTHDVAVGIKERVEPRELRGIIEGAGFRVRREKRWPLFLAPAIYLTRARQRRRLARGLGSDAVESDVKPMHPIPNGVFYALARLSTLWPWPSAGSSVFYVLEPR